MQEHKQTITAGETTVEIISLISEKRYDNKGILRNVMRASLPTDKGITTEQINALVNHDWVLKDGMGEEAPSYEHKGYSEIEKIEITFLQVDDVIARNEQLQNALTQKEQQIAEQEQEITKQTQVIEELIPEATDEMAAKHKEYVTKWVDGGGMVLKPNDRFVKEKVLYKYIGITEYITKATDNPDKIATMFVRINDPNEEKYPDYVKGTYGKGYRCWHRTRLWESTIDSNTFEPAATSEYWTDITDIQGIQKVELSGNTEQVK